MQLVDFDAEAFLRETWQRRPLLIRNPWDAWHNPLEPDELAGLACEPGVESRLVTQSGEQWRLEHGPLPARRFAELGDRMWTLLVQAVDHHVPEVAGLLAPFRFIPNWRIDDVMVSYATDGGGVGAHFDNYDVFLIQGLGSRRWQIGQRCDASTPLLPHDDLRLLAEFAPTDEWILEPGDILYVPPGVAHNGTAVSPDCMTYSVGFRAPSRADLIGGWAEHVIAGLTEDDRFGDAGMALPANPGQISAEALGRLQQMVTRALADPDHFARWFGEYCTTPRNHEIDWRPDLPPSAPDPGQPIAQGVPLIRNPASRFAFVPLAGSDVLLFVDGEAYECSGAEAAFAEALCASDCVILDPALLNTEPGRHLLKHLLAEGSVAFAPDD